MIFLCCLTAKSACVGNRGRVVTKWLRVRDAIVVGVQIVLVFLYLHICDNSVAFLTGVTFWMSSVTQCSDPDRMICLHRLHRKSYNSEILNFLDGCYSCWKSQTVTDLEQSSRHEEFQWCLPNLICTLKSDSLTSRSVKPGALERLKKLLGFLWKANVKHARSIPIGSHLEVAVAQRIMYMGCSACLGTSMVHCLACRTRLEAPVSWFWNWYQTK